MQGIEGAGRRKSHEVENLRSALAGGRGGDRGAGVLSRGALLLTGTLALSGLALFPTSAAAMCEIIPGVESTFRGARGSLNRPFGIPGQPAAPVAVMLSPGQCDPKRPSARFRDLDEDGTAVNDHYVSLVFQPAGAPPQLLVLAPPEHLEACEAGVAAAASAFEGGQVACRSADTAQLAIPTDTRLEFAFPDTAGWLDAAPEWPLTGPVRIAVTPVEAPLPVDLARWTCAQCLSKGHCAASKELLACVDELYARDGTCATKADKRHATFPGVTALPPVNDYGALCESPEVCEAQPGDLAFGLDEAGNALVPIDWRGILLERQRVPIPRLVRGRLSIPAFEGSADPARIPGPGFLSSFSLGGHRLPPLLESFGGVEAEEGLHLFGAVDAALGVLRVSRTSPTDRECRAPDGTAQGIACVDDATCPGAGTCVQAFQCYAGPEPVSGAHCSAGCGDGQTCGPALFDFAPRAVAAAGPVLVPASDRELQAENPVPLEGIVKTSVLLALVEPEALSGQALNADDDQTDAVLRIRDRVTGRIHPIGQAASDGRAVVEVRRLPRRVPAVVAEGPYVAFLEPEPLEGGSDSNGNGIVFDTVLRIFRLEPDCPPGESCAVEITGEPLAVDPAPVVNGESLHLSGGLLVYRVPEPANAPATTIRVSVGSDGSQADGVSQTGRMSPDARWVAFESDAALDPRDDNGKSDIYLRDMVTGVTQLVSVDSEGRVSQEGGSSVPPEDWAFSLPSLSADGRYVAFTSAASDLVPGDVNGDCESAASPDFDKCTDVFVHDRVTGQTRRVSVAADGVTGGDHASMAPALSADGRTVVFESRASNLADPETDFDCYFFKSVDGQPFLQENCRDVFLRDLASGSTERASVSTGGEPGRVFHNPFHPEVEPTVEEFRKGLGMNRGGSYRPAVSADGSVVAFGSTAENLVSDKTSVISDTYVRTRGDTEPETLRVSVTKRGDQANNPRVDFESHVDGAPALSADGRVVAFRSRSSVLIPKRRNPFSDLFVRDRETGEVEQVNKTYTGGEPAGFVREYALSADGRFVVYSTTAGDIVPPEVGCDACIQVYVVDRLTGLTHLVGRGEGGNAANVAGGGASISGDGRSVVFTSPQDGLVAGDTNGVRDLFVRGPDATRTDLDLNQDGDLNDILLQVRDLASGGDPVTLGVASQVRVAGRSVAFLVPDPAELQLGRKHGEVHWVADATTAPVEPLGLVASDLALSSRWLAALELEDSATGDRNGDGDKNDEVLTVRRLDSGQSWQSLELAATSVAVIDFSTEASALVALVDEAAQQEDRNGDGDFEDDVVEIFRLEPNGGVVSLGSPGTALEFVAGGSLVAFRSRESYEGRDLNGDGDLGDDVLQ
ncbi:MAG: hypothetical protein MJE66_08850, partial [Proteobacteria bacterium]|nr:hypothetical protein [Pseudomonadota bacterium]